MKLENKELRQQLADNASLWHDLQHDLVTLNAIPEGKGRRQQVSLFTARPWPRRASHLSAAQGACGGGWGAVGEMPCRRDSPTFNHQLISHELLLYILCPCTLLSACFNLRQPEPAGSCVAHASHANASRAIQHRLLEYKKQTRQKIIHLWAEAFGGVGAGDTEDDDQVLQQPSGEAQQEP